FHGIQGIHTLNHMDHRHPMGMEMLAHPGSTNGYVISRYHPHMCGGPSYVKHQHRSRTHHVEPDSSKILPGCKQLYTQELDVRCRICGDQASGFHYGVHSCEGCKGFFRRTLKKQLVYTPCKTGSQCRIDQITRNKCQYCRYQKCLNAGMSQDAVRFGRMPKAEREKLEADREEMHGSCGEKILELRALSDLIKAAFSDNFRGTCVYNHNTVRKRPSVTNPMEKEIACFLGDMELLTSLDSGTFQQVFLAYQDMILPLLESSAKFVKKIPGFRSLPLTDQINLLKHGSFPVATLLMHTAVDQHGIQLFGRMRQFLVSRKLTNLCEEAQLLLTEHVALADKVNSFQLQLGEKALFCASILLQDVPGLHESHKIEQIQLDLLDALRLELKHNHPRQRLLFPKLLLLIPDLRQITENFGRHLQKGSFLSASKDSDVTPLLREIFDVGH
ncbi:peroxisome proliferator-activated receptor delta-like, partial [Octopus vulgaris]